MDNENMLNRVWDKIGICASGICLVHCLATPILLLFFPSFKISSQEHSHIHEILGVFVVVSILMAVYPHCKKHGHKDIILLALIGVILVLFSIFSHDIPLYFSHGITVIGSILLIWAHIKNMKVRHGKCESETGCSNH